MKLHTLTIMAGMTVCLLAACSREQLAPEPQGRYTITAIRENGGTKTSVDENYSLNWNAEDVIGVFNGAESTHHKLTLTDGDGTPTATFELLEGALEEGDVFAYYPYDEGTVLTKDGKITVDLGGQTYGFDAESKDLDNFGKYFYMTDKATAEAGSTNVDVSFRNPLSAFVFNLSNNGEENLTIKSVSVGTADGSEVFGTAGTLDLADPEASEATTKAASASASLNNVVLEVGAAIDIPVVVFPCDLSGIELVFTVTYTAGEDTGEQTISKTLTGRNLARNSFAVIRLDFGENAAVDKLKDVLKNGGTYDLTCSITGNFTVTSEKPVTINLNGFTITNDPSAEGTGDTFTVNPGSNLTISGEGTVDNTSHGKAAIYNNGTVTLNGGTYTRSAENSSDTDSKDPDFNSYYVILNHGDMTINEGVNIVSSGTYSSLINTGYRDYLAEDERAGYIEGTGQEFPRLTINGGTFEGGVITIKNDLNGTLEINNGNFTNSTVGNIQNAYITTINGGNFKNKAGTNHIASVYYGGADAPYSRGETTINDGTFEGGTIIAEGAEAGEASITVNGGSFNCNFSNSSGKSGYESGVVSINNGSFTIGTWAVLQSIAGFLTEDASITAKAQNGFMNMNCEEPIIFNAQEVTLDLNGKPLRYMGSSSDVFEIKSGNVSISNGKITTPKYNSEADPYGGISVSGNASLTIEDIQVESSSTCFAVADQGSLTIRNSTVKADSYAVTSNATNSEQNITVTLENSEFSGNTPVLLNIPSTITVDRCTITGDTQGMVVRGGNATITDSNITLTIEGSIEENEFFADYFDTINWGQGNTVNVAALTIGNKLEGSYQYPTSVSLKGNTVLTVSGEAESLFPVVYAHANSGEGLGVTFNYDGTVKFVGTHEPQREYGSSNIVVNGEPFTPATE